MPIKLGVTGVELGLGINDDVVFASLTVDNNGIHILDTDASHDLILAVGSNLAADRILTFATGDAARTLTLNGNPTLNDWFDQAVKEASSPSFAGLTLAGDIDIGTNLLKTTNHLLKEQDANGFIIRNAADSADRDLYLKTLRPSSSINFIASPGYLAAYNNDNSEMILQGRDNGVGLVEVAKIKGAADPYFKLTLGTVLGPMAQPGTPVEGMLIYNSATNKLNVYTGAAWEEVTSA